MVATDRRRQPQGRRAGGRRRSRLQRRNWRRPAPRRPLSATRRVPRAATVVDDKRAQANEEVAGTLQEANERTQAAERRDRAGPAVLGGDPVGRPWPAGCWESGLGARAVPSIVGVHLHGFGRLSTVVNLYRTARRLRGHHLDHQQVRGPAGAQADGQPEGRGAQPARREREGRPSGWPPPISSTPSGWRRAEAEARHIVEEARVDSVRIGEQLRVQADVEAERIKVQGGQQVSLLRAQTDPPASGRPRRRVGRARATDLVKAHVADPQAQSATVDRFLDELESMAPAAFAPEVASIGYALGQPRRPGRCGRRGSTRCPDR